MRSTTARCTSWCVDHSDDEGEATCAAKAAFFGPEIDYGPEIGMTGRSGEVYAYRLDDEPTTVVLRVDGSDRPGVVFTDVDVLSAVHAALQLDPQGFASAVATVIEKVRA